MSKCGHVYCFPCILCHLNISDNKWARCTLCFDSVHERHLKSVKTDSRISSTGIVETILVCHPRPILHSRQRSVPVQLYAYDSCNAPDHYFGSLAIAYLALRSSPSTPSSFHSYHDVFSFAKFMLVTLTLELRVLASMDDVLGTYFEIRRWHGAEISNPDGKSCCFKSEITEK